MKLYRLFAGVVAWFGLILQYDLLLGQKGGDIAAASIDFLGYFTILANLYCALALTIPLVWPASRPGRFLAGASPRSAAALYIAVTCVTYAAVLQGLWAPKGWALVADVTLHYVTPILFLIDWLAFTPRRILAPRMVPAWLVFPFVYGCACLVRGAVGGFYPYPFLDAGKLGYLQIGFNICLFVTAFAGVALMLVAINGRLGREAAPSRPASG